MQRANQSHHTYSLVACAIYYVIWAYGLPKWKGYQLRQELIALDDNGTQTNRLKKVPNDEVAAWDAVHDASGRRIDSERQDSESQPSSVDQIPVETKGVAV
jgi:hypothetical protein